jgi:hypothetical protein
MNLAGVSKLQRGGFIDSIVLSYGNMNLPQMSDIYRVDYAGNSYHCGWQNAMRHPYSILNVVLPELRFAR